MLAADREAELREEAEVLARSEGGGGHTSEHRPDGLPDDEDGDESDEPWSPPDVTSEDDDDWEFLVDRLADQILWEDGDYEAGNRYLDADPA